MMFSEDRWLLPDGIDEVFPNEARHLESLRAKILNLFACWGYQLVIPPMIEYIDSLLVGTGYDLDLQTFKLIDQSSGRLMGIRADMTPQVARIDARMKVNDFPTRLCYVGTVLHTYSDHLERSRSPLQIGAELYGHSGADSDIEIIRLGLAMLRNAGLTSIHLDFGHVGIYRGLVQIAGLNEVEERKLFEILQRKDRTELTSFLDTAALPQNISEWLSILLELNGPQQILAVARERLSEAGSFVHKALDELEAIAAGLNNDTGDVPINFDLAELRGYHYQTGIVFAAFVSGYGREIARGGRYDEIGKVFGRARPATGFSADLKVLLRLAKYEAAVSSKSVIYAPKDSDAGLAYLIDKLRNEGSCVLQELSGQGATATDLGCDFEIRKLNAEWIVTPVEFNGSR